MAVTPQGNNPPATPDLREEDLQAYKFFERLRGLFDALRPCAWHSNRKLHFDEYALGVLFYFFNPAITSLRGLQMATDFKKVQKALGIRRMSLDFRTSGDIILISGRAMVGHGVRGFDLCRAIA